MKMKRLTMVRRIPRLGDDVDHQYVQAVPLNDDAPQTLDTFVHSDTVKTASAVALTYHGYRRTGSLLWALAYGVAGRLIPTVAVPVAVAQGFGKKRTCTTE